MLIETDPVLIKPKVTSIVFGDAARAASGKHWVTERSADQNAQGMIGVDRHTSSWATPR